MYSIRIFDIERGPARRRVGWDMANLSGEYSGSLLTFFTHAQNWRFYVQPFVRRSFCDARTDERTDERR